MSNPREQSGSFEDDHRELSENLDRQYHKIGISAVLAALRYHGDVPEEPHTDSADVAYKHS